MPSKTTWGFFFSELQSHRQSFQDRVVLVSDLSVGWVHLQSLPLVSSIFKIEKLFTQPPNDSHPRPVGPRSFCLWSMSESWKGRETKELCTLYHKPCGPGLGHKTFQQKFSLAGSVTVVTDWVTTQPWEKRGGCVSCCHVLWALCELHWGCCPIINKMISQPSMLTGAQRWSGELSWQQRADSPWDPEDETHPTGAGVQGISWMTWPS